MTGIAVIGGKRPERSLRMRKQPHFKQLTDLGIVLIHQGNYSSAVRLFVAIEKLHPGRHETAANLGTALELMGRDTLARRWIRLGIQRNRHEHEGTEWLHLRILEAKIALRSNPKYLEGRSVAGVSFDPVARITHGLSARQRRQAGEAA
jgi:lipoprotein NlpI